jgi:hypothetical protein
MSALRPLVHSDSWGPLTPSNASLNRAENCSVGNIARVVAFAEYTLIPSMITSNVPE